jgi:hypothetical protein
MGPGIALRGRRQRLDNGKARGPWWRNTLRGLRHYFWRR